MTELRASRVSFLVPTKNRPDFVVRLLRYYAQQGFAGRLLIGDSSDPGPAERIQRAVAGLGDRLAVRYEAFPGCSEPQTTSQLLGRVDTSYVAFLPDDDLVVADAVGPCVAFLDAHPDYSLAHGIGALVRLDRSGPWGAVAGTAGYSLRAPSAVSACARLLDHLERYSVMSFSIHRTAQMRAAYDRVPELTDHAFTELLPCCLSVAQGRVHRIDRLYLIRQEHDRRYLNADIFDWVTGPGWRASYELFRNRLAEELVRQDGVSMEQALEVIKRGFWKSLASTLSTKWRQRFQPEAPTGGRWRRIAAGLPGLRPMWHGLQARLPGAGSRLSLACLSAPSSRHGADFAGIRQAFEPQAEEGAIAEELVLRR